MDLLTRRQKVATSNSGHDKILENYYALHDVNVETLSKDKRLNKLLQSVVTEVKFYAKDQIKHIKQLTQIGLALSVEKDIRKLLELIVDEARDLSNADAGTLYILDPALKALRFEIMQNNTMDIRKGGTGDVPVSLPDVPLYIKDTPNHANVCSFVALNGETVNIPDVYKTDGFDFSGTREYDRSTGYHCKSMLVIPMKNHENQIIGVLQLLNAMDPETGAIISFSSDHAYLIAALASQAAVALTNTQLIEDLKNLFYAFIKSIATAIDEKSPHTGGHINRVVDLTMMIADSINADNSGPFKEFSFTENELEELRLSAWMHDVGKITTPEHIVDKSTKLECIYDGIELIRTRFELMEEILEKTYLSKKLELAGQNKKDSCKNFMALEKTYKENLKRIRDDFAFILACNSPGQHMDEEKVEKIKSISKKTYVFQNKEYPCLTEDEVKKLCIKKGTLDEEERKFIENHAQMTYKILSQLPFPPRLSNVPQYSSGHHERPDGSGYPNGLNGETLPLQARILAIADVFEALTAKDRPYKESLQMPRVIQIMEQMKSKNHIDPDVFDLFVQSNLHEAYAEKLMHYKTNMP